MKSIFIKMNYFYDLLSALKSAHYKIIHTFMRDFWRGEGFEMRQNML